jgi:lysophospholipase L1-like esterase
VTLPPPHLGITKILTFGDSITEGEVPVSGEFRIRPRFVEPAKSYPADITTLLAQRYTAQGASRVDAFTFILSNDSNDCATDPPAPTTSGIVVINAGCLGAQAKDLQTLKRLNDKIRTYHPDVMLLLIGVNDLDPRNPDASISAALGGVQALIACARANGVQVMVGTLLPAIQGTVNGGSSSLIEPFNNRLWGVATSAGATVVDLYSDIATDVADWIAYDGLHPTEAGYQEMARVWFNSIQRAFDVPSSSTVPRRSGVRPNTIVPRASRR